MYASVVYAILATEQPTRPPMRQCKRTASGVGKCIPECQQDLLFNSHLNSIKALARHQSTCTVRQLHRHGYSLRQRHRQSSRVRKTFRQGRSLARFSMANLTRAFLQTMLARNVLRTTAVSTSRSRTSRSISAEIQRQGLCRYGTTRYLPLFFLRPWWQFISLFVGVPHGG